jgi:hypothetical protein
VADWGCASWLSGLDNDIHAIPLQFRKMFIADGKVVCDGVTAKNLLNRHQRNINTTGAI